MASKRCGHVIIDYPFWPADYQLPRWTRISESCKVGLWKHRKLRWDKDKNLIQDIPQEATCSFGSLKKEPYEKLNFKNPLKGANSHDRQDLDQFVFQWAKRWPLTEKRITMHSQLIRRVKEYSPIYFFRWKWDYAILIMEGSWPYLEFGWQLIVSERACGNWNRNWSIHIWEKKHIHQWLPSFSGSGSKKAMMMCWGLLRRIEFKINFKCW